MLFSISNIAFCTLLAHSISVISSYTVSPDIETDCGEPFAKMKECSGFNGHLMTGPKGNSEFCFPVTLNVPRGEAALLCEV